MTAPAHPTAVPPTARRVGGIGPAGGRLAASRPAVAPRSVPSEATRSTTALPRSGSSRAASRRAATPGSERSAEAGPGTIRASLGAHRSTAGGAPARLPWWALLLPAVAFAVLLALTVSGGGADASAPAGVQHSVTQTLDAVPPVFRELWESAVHTLLG